MKRSIALLAAVAVACAREGAAPSSPSAAEPVVVGPVGGDGGTPLDAPKMNDVVQRITSGGEIYARLAACEALVVEAGKDPDERSLDIDVSSPLGCASRRKVSLVIDVRDPRHLRCVAARSQVGRMPRSTICALDDPSTETATPSAGEAVLDGVRLFAERAACEAAAPATPTTATCFRNELVAAVAERREDVPTGEFVTRFEALIADPSAKVWHRMRSNYACEQYSVGTSGSSFEFVRIWTDNKASYTDKETFAYDAKCKKVTYGGSSFSQTSKNGLGRGTKMSGSPAETVAPSPRDPDMLPFYPRAWFYTRRACERSER